VLVGLGSFYLGAHLLHLPSDFWYRDKLAGRTVGLLIASVALGFLGMVLGWGAAVQVKVRHESTNHTIALLWHCVACGSLIWVTLLGLILQKLYGREGCIALVRSLGEVRFMVWVLGAGTVGCLAIGCSWLLARLMPMGGPPRALACFLVALPITATMAYLTFAALSIESRLWLLVSLLMPAVLVPTCAYMIHRDRRGQGRAIDVP
jgi:hypothetical protein